MKKILMSICGIVIILCFLAILAKTTLPILASNKLTKMTGVPVTIKNMSFSPSKVTANKIHISNPSEYDKVSQALSVKILTLQAPLTNFIKSHIVIEEIVLDNAHMGLQFNSPKNPQGNWTIIVNNVSKYIAANPNKAKDKDSTISIKKFIIKNLQIELAYTKGGKSNHMLQPIPQITLSNLQSQGSLPLGQILNIVIQETLRNVLPKEGLQNMLEGILQPKEKSVIDTIKGLFSNASMLNDNRSATPQAAFS